MQFQGKPHVAIVAAQPRAEHNVSSAAFARPRTGEAADQQQEAEEAGKYWQYANAADHAGVAHFQADPVVTLVGIAGAYRDDPRYVEAVAVIETARVAASSVGDRCEHLGGRGHLGEFARVGGADIDQRIELAVGCPPQSE